VGRRSLKAGLFAVYVAFLVLLTAAVLAGVMLFVLWLLSLLFPNGIGPDD